MKDKKLALQKKYNALKKLNLKLDLTRGKPSKKQLSLSNSLLNNLSPNSFNLNGVDIRNYGEIDGLPDTKKLGSSLLGLKSSNIIANGTSSLNLIAAMMQTLFF